MILSNKIEYSKFRSNSKTEHTEPYCINKTTGTYNTFSSSHKYRNQYHLFYYRRYRSTVYTQTSEQKYSFLNVTVV